MPEDFDPTEGMRISNKRRQRAAAGVLAIFAIWAFWPLPKVDSKSELALRQDMPDEIFGAKGTVREGLVSSAGAMNLPAFEAKLWVVPPRPVEVAAIPPPSPPTPPPPLKLQLVAIVRDGSEAASDSDVLRAVLFDPEANKVHKLAAGATIQRYKVQSISSDVVELMDTQFPGAPVHALRMRLADSDSLLKFPKLSTTKQHSGEAKSGNSASADPASGPAPMKVDPNVPTTQDKAKNEHAAAPAGGAS